MPMFALIMDSLVGFSEKKSIFKEPKIIKNN